MNLILNENKIMKIIKFADEKLGISYHNILNRNIVFFEASYEEMTGLML